MAALRIVGLSSSPRHANTEILVQEALRVCADEHGAETRMVSFARKKIEPCIVCQECEKQRRPCVLDDDWNELVEPLVDPVPDGLIIGSPVYFHNVNASLRAYMERCSSLLRQRWDPEYPHPAPDWSHTVAGALSVGGDRDTGRDQTTAAIVQWLLACGFPVVSSDTLGAPTWSTAPAARTPLEDSLGLSSARSLGRRVAGLAECFTREE